MVYFVGPIIGVFDNSSILREQLTNRLHRLITSAGFIPIDMYQATTLLVKAIYHCVKESGDKIISLEIRL